MSSTTGPRCSPRPATTGGWPFGTPTDRQGRAESWFETGLLHADDWVAGWIGRDPTTFAEVDPPQDDDRSERTHRLLPCAHLRRVFTLVAFIGGAWA
jgi:hypothetical protein